MDAGDAFEIAERAIERGGRWVDAWGWDGDARAGRGIARGIPPGDDATSAVDGDRTTR